ncbi:MAG: hypothetical protein CMN30_04285 [Sandaracinus sp.]|nr:hypothetical protein [Sandaracinus sp.]|tara:strand:+ start:4933 stop:5742 length:810 start_codon:yes stop_codon:yes gene_type:complete
MMASPSFHSGTLMSLIHRVEQTDAGTGALICQASGDQLATVLLEEGRICWAVASGMRRRLTDLLLEGNDRLDRKSLESIYRDCRGRNVPLGEELVRRGVVEAGGLRNALAEHTSEALVRVGHRDDVTFDWVAHRTTSYSPSYTFDTLDIALRVARKVYPDAVRNAEAVLARTQIPAVAFLQSKCGDAFPVAAVQLDEVGGDDLTNRGRLFRELQEMLRQFGQGSSIELAVWRSASDRQLALTTEGDLLVAHFLVRPTQLGLLVKARMKT